ncbi:hypothetical protein [Tunturiibacter gelidiferens]|uniref:Uncharacterized protein n=1 Tax=Tunturiibacter gelidiferens TaxID=3069689 RepID=A0AAU7YUN9_9BACT
MSGIAAQVHQRQNAGGLSTAAAKYAASGRDDDDFAEVEKTAILLWPA